MTKPDKIYCVIGIELAGEHVSLVPHIGALVTLYTIYHLELFFSTYQISFFILVQFLKNNNFTESYYWFISNS